MPEGQCAQGCRVARHEFYWPGSQFEVKDVAWDENLGAETLDLILLNHFADEFQEKHGVDIRAFPKAVAKLKRQVLTLGTSLGTAEYLV